MGEVTENNRTFVLPNESYPYSFKMKYAYDSWNRIQNITYPDGEKVNYWYNTGGMLDSVVGKVTVSNMVNPKGGDEVAPVGPTPSTTYTYRYITHTTYNEFELKSAQWYGNNTRSQYTYDLLQRLSRLRLYNSANSQLQDITYTYDRVGNITRIQNTAGMVSSMGGQYNCRYTYDSLYRLVQATDTSYRGFKLAGRYEQRTSYFPDGRIQYKQDETWTNTSTFPFISNTYTYGNSDQPHTLTSTGNGINNPTYYTWDANGNMTKQGSNIYLQWDEENRLKSVSKPAQGVCFFYDASGERFYKNYGQKQMMLVNGLYYMNIPFYDSPVLYTSPYVVVTRDGYTKHYFVEAERFASRIGDGSISGINSHAASSAALAAKQADVDFYAPDSIRPDNFTFLRSMPNHLSAHHTTYWQHSDHLGSASWVTDTNGLGYQHFQYRAWGEPFIEQNSTANGYETRYTFSGKERDEETGYSYFGARYYNSALSIWLSVDPMSDKYPSMSPYTYCANNPVKLVDPNGEWSKSVHHAMIKRAVSELQKEGLINNNQAKNLIKGMCKGSDKADGFLNGNQSVKRSYIHFMRDPSKTIEESKKQSLNFVKDNIDEYKKTGDYEFLGMAAHTMMDAVCPSHVDENGNPRVNDLPSPAAFVLDFISEGRMGARDKMLCHIAGDKNPTEQQMKTAVDNVKNVIVNGMDLLDK